ncbi:adenylosuccinate synthetase [Kiloniella litopenaei]|uniref:adenylosuccinate synthetase n=1 Tax=Kiloniella litopenaei TaxID=1549748 RepID=UPI003BABF5F9
MKIDTDQFKIVVLSGEICSGKSKISDGLRSKYNASVIKTRELILAELPKTLNTRIALQRAGNKLDKNTKGQWIADALAKFLEKHQTSVTPSGLFVIDAIRKQEQIRALRKAYGADVHHIHVTASADELERRFIDRASEHDAQAIYQKIKREKTERQVRGLEQKADVIVSTDKCTADAALVRATALLNLYPRTNDQLVDVIIGGQYGSEGKGNIVGHLAPEYKLLVRVGGPNAGHKVYADGKPETYFHLPSGSERSPNSKLLLGAGALIYPPKLMTELAEHQIEADRLSIDPQAMIITDKDRKDEAESLKSISSTAQGVGFATANKITGRGRYEEGTATHLKLAKDVPELLPFIKDAQEVIAEHLLKGHLIMLEGTQGTSLSIHHGEYPFVTSRDTTVAGCLADAGIAPTNVRRVIMVCRTYPIRVGGPSGPMNLEVNYEELSARSGISVEELKQTERTTTTNKQRRIAEFDWVQLKRSVQMNGPTDIALTFVDYIDKKNKSAYRFEQLTEETLRFIEEVERVSGRPVSLLSTNFSYRNIIDRRSW